MIDLSQLPPPDIIETLDYESILAERKARLISLYPVADQPRAAAEIALESDPRTKLLQESAYREITLRQRINDGARAVMLAYATGSDLQHLSAVFGVEQLVLDAGDPLAAPPVPPTYENDTSLRRRTQLAPESYTSCGTFEAYRFHALSVAGVTDAAVLRPEPGVVRVVLLADSSAGAAPTDLIQSTASYLSADDRRSVNDYVEVVPAEILNFNIHARLTLYPGPSAGPVLTAAHAAAQSYAKGIYKLGYDATLSGIYAALHQPGVQRVELLEPLSDVICDISQALRLLDLVIDIDGATNV